MCAVLVGATLVRLNLQFKNQALSRKICNMKFSWLVSPITSSPELTEELYILWHRLELYYLLSYSWSSTLMGIRYKYLDLHYIHMQLLRNILFIQGSTLFMFLWVAATLSIELCSEICYLAVNELMPIEVQYFMNLYFFMKNLWRILTYPHLTACHKQIIVINIFESLISVTRRSIPCLFNCSQDWYCCVNFHGRIADFSNVGSNIVWNTTISALWTSTVRHRDICKHRKLVNIIIFGRWSIMDSRLVSYFYLEDVKGTRDVKEVRR